MVTLVKRPECPQQNKNYNRPKIHYIYTHKSTHYTYIKNATLHEKNGETSVNGTINGILLGTIKKICL
jgi:hypothetical protein